MTLSLDGPHLRVRAVLLELVAVGAVSPTEVTELLVSLVGPPLGTLPQPVDSSVELPDDAFSQQGPRPPIAREAGREARPLGWAH